MSIPFRHSTLYVPTSSSHINSGPWKAIQKRVAPQKGSALIQPRRYFFCGPHIMDAI